MSDSLESLSRKMGGARDLASVVRTMKALAASSVGQYETAVRSLVDYYRTVELGLVIITQRPFPRVKGMRREPLAQSSSARIRA